MESRKKVLCKAAAASLLGLLALVATGCSGRPVDTPSSATNLRGNTGTKPPVVALLGDSGSQSDLQHALVQAMKSEAQFGRAGLTYKQMVEKVNETEGRLDGPLKTWFDDNGGAKLQKKQRAEMCKNALIMLESPSSEPKPARSPAASEDKKPVQPEEKEICPICVDKFEEDDVIAVPNNDNDCRKHRFHKKCHTEYVIDRKIKDRKPLKCPICRKHYDLQNVKHFKVDPCGAEDTAADKEFLADVARARNAAEEVGGGEEGGAAQAAEAAQAAGAAAVGGGSSKCSQDGLQCGYLAAPAAVGCAVGSGIAIAGAAGCGPAEACMTKALENEDWCIESWGVGAAIAAAGGCAGMFTGCVPGSVHTCAQADKGEGCNDCKGTMCAPVAAVVSLACSN